MTLALTTSILATTPAIRGFFGVTLLEQRADATLRS
jgi:hypothetical protein